MKHTFILYTDKSLSLLKFIKELEPIDVVYEDIGNNFLQGRYSKGLNHVWIYDDPTVIQNLKEEGLLFSIESKLGNKPVSSFVIESNSESESDSMVMEIAKKFAQKNNCVLESHNQKLLSGSELH